MEVKEYFCFEPKKLNPVDLGYGLAHGSSSHHLVDQFLKMSQEEIAASYAFRQGIKKERVLELLKRETTYMLWSGSDILNVIDVNGKKRKVILETNSCPSGAKDLPSANFGCLEDSAYGKILSATLLPRIEREGDLAVLWDKNKVETKAYGQVLANLTGRRVHYIPLFNQDDVKQLNFDPHTLKINGFNIAGTWRYVTQEPWKRISVYPKTVMINPIIACIAGGRNKLIAAKAYNEFNQNNPDLAIDIPYTTEEMNKQEVINLLKKWKYGVVKLPYSNAGQGVFTIASERDLKEFEQEVSADKSLILQQLIGFEQITSNGTMSPLTHVGGIVDGKRFAIDLRMMVINGQHQDGQTGYKPVSLYARRAAQPLEDLCKPDVPSWEVLGTNLSELTGKEKYTNRKKWAVHNDRRIVTTEKDFPQLDLSLDDLVDAYVTTVKANAAINDIAEYLMEGGEFHPQRFSELNGDQTIVKTLIY